MFVTEGVVPFPTVALSSSQYPLYLRRTLHSSTADTRSSKHAGSDYGVCQPGTWPGAPTPEGALRHRLNNWKYGDTKLRFRHVKEFIRK